MTNLLLIIIVVGILFGLKEAKTLLFGMFKMAIILFVAILFFGIIIR